MEFSPNDIRNADFPASMRGYDKQEVKKYLEQIASSLEKIKQDNLRLSMEGDSLRTQITALRSFEDTIKSAAIDARRNADATIASAKHEAEQIVLHARRDAEAAIGNRTAKILEIEGQLESLELTKKSYIGKFRMLMQTHLEIVEEIASGTKTSAPSPTRTSAPNASPTEWQDNIQVTDSSDITRKSREHVSSRPTVQEPVFVEEANAVGSIVSMKATSHQPFEKSAGKPVDPELAAALEQYVHHGGERPESEQTTYTRSSQRTTEAPPHEEVSYDFEPQGNDHNNLSIDAKGQSEHEPTDEKVLGSSVISFEQLGKPMSPAPDTQLGPESLAAELDRVVAKFEEEMSKADKNR
jgi:DivIVA domain-containing protein